MAEEIGPSGQPVINLGRDGHYSTQEGCQVAKVVNVREPILTDGESDDGVDQIVNLAVWTHSGEAFRRVAVPVSDVNEDGKESFHLNRNCPWQR